MDPMDPVDIEGRTSREVVDSVERAVRDGRAAPGDVLPSVRALASHLQISPATVAAAYRDLRIRGVLTSEVGRNTRISARPPLISRAPAAVPAGARDLSDGNPDPELMPSVTRAAHGVDLGHHGYSSPSMLPALVVQATRQFAELGVTEEQLCLAGGAMDGVERVLSAWLRPGDQVLVEDPCYTGVLDLVRACGLTAVPVAVDERGLVPDALRAALTGKSAALVLTPRAQNPTGAALDAVRAAELASVLERREDVLVVENDHMGPMAGSDFFTLTAGRPRWAVIRSVSKSLGPDLRLAYVAGDTMTVSRVEGRQRLGSGWVSHILQQIVVELSEDPGVHDLVRQAERTYLTRREALLSELAARGVAASGRSGLNVMIPVQEEAATLRQLQERGWLLRAGEPHRLASAPFVRATTATLHPEEAAELAAAVAESVRPQRGTRSV
ncbi:aminotransferase class I/II-fold pyridoxal phosphate-dependent enzyme [Streptacidiphilus sp. NEAU-YB345]|uniref:Aminotransferase class I/II-fold pyridoxal phosphate-dependent enzyme n=2 Tax=Streptacidiphilus fuscans TaxID=2789292 RepID=A0A931B541_9ACTN|nr:aminotransferase class I/II-fold pyridoxal phosphate-dependent enzyme [Streptacidiphilus fuscans]